MKTFELSKEIIQEIGQLISSKKNKDIKKIVDEIHYADLAEIINELEPSSRGIYGGAIGHISWNGNIDTAIAIRTAVIKDGLIHVGAGAGIVADSDPESEWRECVQKSKVFADAMEMIS